MSSKMILWIYIVLLEVGGLIGFFKGKSAVSLIMSSICAAILVLVNVGIVNKPVDDVVMAVLIVVFAMRLAKTKKFMPSGMLIIVTLAALILRHVKFN